MLDLPPPPQDPSPHQDNEIYEPCVVRHSYQSVFAHADLEWGVGPRYIDPQKIWIDDHWTMGVMFKEAIEINQNHKVYYLKHTPETIDFKHVKHFQPETIVIQMVIILDHWSILWI